MWKQLLKNILIDAVPSLISFLAGKFRKANPKKTSGDWDEKLEEAIREGAKEGVREAFDRADKERNRKSLSFSREEKKKGENE